MWLQYKRMFFVGALICIAMTSSWLLVSSFSTHHTHQPSDTANRNSFSSASTSSLIKQFDFYQEPRGKSTYHRQRQRNEPSPPWSLLILTETSSSSSQQQSSPDTMGDLQEIRDLFSKYCDKDSFINRKTIESMPPFVDLLVR